jgi:N-methylhydantoinase B/oxoprolinase/acetone carboxylase alpha subunit
MQCPGWRAIEFLAPMQAAILSERRTRAPFGLHGAGAGRRGRNILIRNGHERELPGKVSLSVRKGDILVIETPGGGGCNPPVNQRHHPISAAEMG